MARKDFEILAQMFAELANELEERGAFETTSILPPSAQVRSRYSPRKGAF